MALVLTIPDEILETIKLPKKQAEKELEEEGLKVHRGQGSAASM